MTSIPKRIALLSSALIFFSSPPLTLDLRDPYHLPVTPSYLLPPSFLSLPLPTPPSLSLAFSLSPLPLPSLLHLPSLSLSLSPLSLPLPPSPSASPSPSRRLIDLTCYRYAILYDLEGYFNQLKQYSQNVCPALRALRCVACFMRTAFPARCVSACCVALRCMFRAYCVSCALRQCATVCCVLCVA